LGRGEQDRAGSQHYHEGRAELPGRHHAQVDHRIAAAEFPGNHQHESQHANRARAENEI
jgi:hypothetical protein